MLKLTALCSTLLAVTAAAQCNPGTLIGPTGGTNQGNTGGTVYFDLTVNTTITITAMDFFCGANTTAGTGFMEVWLGPTTWIGNNTTPGLWTIVDSTIPGSVAPSTLSTGTMTNGITLAPGSYGVALRSQLNQWNHGYSNPPVTMPISTPELSMNSGGATNGFLTGSTFTPRHWNGNITYTCGGTPIVVATSEPYGQGCYQFNTSYGEIIPNASTSLDIADQSHTLMFLGSVYSVSGTAVNSFVPPGPNAVPLPLAAGIDVASVATALGGALPFPVLYPAGHIPGGVGIADDLEVCASGFITPVDVAGPGLSAAAPGAQAGDISPTLDEFFNTGLERWAPLWQDMTPAGNVVAEVLVTGELVITWNMVLVTGFTTAPFNTFQVVFHPSGTVEYRYDVGTTGQGGGPVPVILGLTQGHGALPEEIDVSVAVLAGFTTEAVDNTALDISLDARPVLGTNPNYLITGYDAPTTPLGVVVVSLTQFNPGISLAGFGMPGCEQYVTPDAIISFLTGGAPQVSFSFINGGIPNLPLYNGVQFLAQAVTLTGDCAGNPCNALGVIASGGLRIFMGTL